MPSLAKRRARAALNPLPAPTMSAISGMRFALPTPFALVVAVGQQRFGGVARGGALQCFAFQFDHHRLLLPCAYQAGIDVCRRSGGEQAEINELRRFRCPADFGLDLLAFE